ncbi:hypothetical protein F8388_025899 [Cannabis sativa]|uniref:DUF4283 domain-containing protein n=1 Tax=Cannabis sativa TaxID=3483 RepID=A0A7J6DTV4_CANSA|nr:hypothetical protein F8388_025899 [Cannabis sativa]
MDIQRVMDRSPWMFKIAPLIFERLKPGDVLWEVPLYHLDIWVQLHDIRSDQFCSRLFIQPTSTIVKPYGTFMKAMSLRTQYAMGAKWLRSGAPRSSNVGGTMVAELRQSTMSAGQDFQGSGGDVNPIVMNNGENCGIIFSPAVLSENNGSKGSEAVGDSKSNLEEEGIVFMDSKRKRTGKKVSIGLVGPTEGFDVWSSRCVGKELN